MVRPDLDAIDAWREAQPDQPGRPEAVRRLMRKALEGDTFDGNVLAIIHQVGDSAYGVTFPQLPACFSAADTWEQILPNAREAVALWLTDQPDLPKPDIGVIATAAKHAREGGGLIAWIECKAKVGAVQSE